MGLTPSGTDDVAPLVSAGHPEDNAMTDFSRLLRWTTCVVLGLMTTVQVVGCAAVPRRYTWIAEPHVTLTMLSANPEPYVGKAVILGGTITAEENSDDYLLICLKNRPLDQDYRPHRPVDSNGPEAGSYWVLVPKQQRLPSDYRTWGRVTVVGRVTGQQRFKTEPVLMLLYMRGWGTDGNHGIWENINPNYVPRIPGGIDLKN
jgi:starvation-inducible outer membrane lipoprotein